MILAVGSATAKLALLLKTKNAPDFTAAFIGADKTITKLIIIGLIILTLSGIGWLFTGYPLTPLLIGKIVLVAVIWVAGPVIDNVIAPRFQKLAPGNKEKPSPEFLSARKQYFVMEEFATGLFYVIVVAWVLLTKGI